jgi:hypothetical protein
MNDVSQMMGDEGAGQDPGQDPGQEQQEDQQPQGKSFLVNKESLPPDVKPGAEFKVRVVQVHDTEAECEIQEEGQDEQAPPDAGEKPETAPGNAGSAGGMFD